MNKMRCFLHYAGHELDVVISGGRSSWICLDGSREWHSPGYSLEKLVELYTRKEITICAARKLLKARGLQFPVQNDG